MLDDFFAGDAPATDSRPSLPSITGFDDWDSDKFDVTKFDESKPNGSKTDEIKKPTLAGQVTFDEKEASKGCKLKSIAFKLEQVSKWKCALIKSWFWLTDLKLSFEYDLPD